MHTSELAWLEVDDTAPLVARMAAAAAREIIEGRRVPGDVLTEVELATAHGASRTPAREVMLRLQAWGLIRLMPKKGGVVTPVTARERRELLAVRVLLERGALEEISSDPAAVGALADELSAVVAGQRAAIARDDLLAFSAADFDFHARIIRSGGNAVVDGMLEGLGPRLAQLTYLALAEQPDQAARLADEHAELAALAARGDATTFAARVREHVARGHFEGRA